MVAIALRRHETRLVWTAAAALAAGLLACALATPLLLPMLLGLAVAGAVLILAYRHTTLFCVAWLIVTGATLEMTLTDLVGPEAFQTVIAAVKATEVALAVVCAVRWGGQVDPLNPAWAFVAMGLAGMANGLHPALSAADSLRSLAGSVAPFAFCFCRLPQAWCRAMIRATCWAPCIAVAGGVALVIPGIRPLFIDSGGERLAGLGHPAFLAGVCLAAIYACLTELYRLGHRRDGILLGINLVILVLTGARAPLFYGLLVTALSLICISSPVVPPRRRILIALGVLAALPLLLVVADAFTSVRVFNLLREDAGNLSGREFLWPAFEAAAGDAPLFGWGIGAGNVIIPPDSQVAKMLHTWAAHNEWLRILVEGGLIGRSLLVLMFTAWVWQHTRRIDPADRLILRFAFLAFACHAITDNVLISSPACVLFSFTAAVFGQTSPGWSPPSRGNDETARIMAPHRDSQTGPAERLGSE